MKELIDDGASDEQLWDEGFGPMVRHHKAFQVYRSIKQKPKDWTTKVIVLTGAPGTGKTRWVKKNFPGCFWKQNSKWWDGYRGQETVVLDDFYGQLPYCDMLRFMDLAPINVETKGGQQPYLARTLVITSNKEPLHWYSSEVKEKHDFGAFTRRIDEHHRMYSDGSTTVELGDPLRLTDNEPVGYDLNETE